MVLRVLELRSYAAARRAVLGARSQEDVPKTPMVEMVWWAIAETARRRKG